MFEVIEIHETYEHSSVYQTKEQAIAQLEYLISLGLEVVIFDQE